MFVDLLGCGQRGMDGELFVVLVADSQELIAMLDVPWYVVVRRRGFSVRGTRVECGGWAAGAARANSHAFSGERAVKGRNATAGISYLHMGWDHSTAMLLVGCNLHSTRGFFQTDGWSVVVQSN